MAEIMRSWPTNDFTYVIDSDVISHGYDRDFRWEEDGNYDLSRVLLGHFFKGNFENWVKTNICFVLIWASKSVIL